MIVKLSELNNNQKEQFINIFGKSFFSLMDKKAKHTAQQKVIFLDAILPDNAAIYLEDDVVVGMVSFSNSRHTAVRFSKQICKEQYGVFYGSITYNILTAFFAKPFVKPGEGYIDFLCVDENYRRKGIASKLLEFVYENTDYQHYYLEVLGKNKGAIKLYERQGYKTVKVKKGLLIWLAIKDYTMIMKWSR